MDFGLKGKVALITGGSEGIGKAAAEVLAEEGAHVVIVARRKDVLELAASAIRSKGGSVLPIAADVTDAQAVEDFVAQAVAHFGRLDIIVNNAGTSSAKPFQSATDEIWQEDLDLKLFAAIRVSRAAIPHLRKQGGGRIINITTVSGKQPAAKSVPTSVSRAAGIALTKALSKEFAADNILVNTVSVGVFKSGQQERAAERQNLALDQHYDKLGDGVPLGRVGEAREAANVIAFLASEAASYVTGASVNVDGGTSGVV
ncbi:SDR family oxidoreductase [Uliginosibacterium sp. H3]|uniref:SDR family oxidoreductase n=1 Tax=Uliginosibacterium silvisoli TaxID=3114758 RepID=A0ABU6K5K3_9RHOO|nr:SDR family oxidoreductase [Uliginosibacterium sp. H3]